MPGSNVSFSHKCFRFYRLFPYHNISYRRHLRNLLIIGTSLSSLQIIAGYHNLGMELYGLFVSVITISLAFSTNADVKLPHASDVYENVKESASHAYDDAKDNVEGWRDTAEYAYDEVAESAKERWTSAQHRGEELKDAAAEKLGDLKDSAQNAFASAKDSAAHTLKTAEELAKNAKDAAYASATSVKDAAAEKLGNLKDTAQETFASAGHKLKDAEGRAKNLKDATAEKLGNVKETVQDTVTSVKDSAGIVTKICSVKCASAYSYAKQKRKKAKFGNRRFIHDPRPFPSSDHRNIERGAEALGWPRWR